MSRILHRIQSSLVGNSRGPASDDALSSDARPHAPVRHSVTVSASLQLRSLLDTYPYTAGLKVGAPSNRLSFDFDEVRPIYDAFPRTVRGLEFDLSELATMTFLQAYVAGRPLTLLPIGLLSRFHHRSTICRTDSEIETPADLAGRRIGVRSYTQTTVVYARGVLEADYGFDSTDVTWISLEEPHVPEFQEPANVQRAAAGETLESLLLSGAVDAAIVGRDRPFDDRIRTVIEDPEEELRWYRRSGVLPINHMLVVRTELARRHPWLLEELRRLFAACRTEYLDQLSSGPEAQPGRDLLAAGIDPVPMGVDAVRPALELAITYAHRQGLIPRPISVDELVDERVAAW